MRHPPIRAARAASRQRRPVTTPARRGPARHRSRRSLPRSAPAPIPRAECHGVAAVAERLRPRQQTLSLVEIPGPRQRQAEHVHRRDIRRLLRHDRPQCSDRIRVALILERNLRHVDVDTDITRIDLPYAVELCACGVGPPLRAGDQPKHVRRLRCLRQQSRRILRRLLGAVEVLGVEKGEAQVELGDAERRLDAQRVAKRCGRLGKLQLLEEGDADVVRSIRPLSCVAGSRLGWRLRRCLRTTDDHRDRARRQPADSRRPHRVIDLDSTTPLPSRIVICRFAGTFVATSTRPLGHVTRTSSTTAAVPKPNVRGNSLCER